jgi:protein-S-isoprenylcysteine O-methyltransferase Ste14
VEASDSQSNRKPLRFVLLVGVVLLSLGVALSVFYIWISANSILDHSLCGFLGFISAFAGLLILYDAYLNWRAKD